MTEQLTNAQAMVKKLRTENLSLKIKLQNIEQTQQNAKKQNEELKTVVNYAGTQITLWNFQNKRKVGLDW